ncbi:hypothetical protein AX17_002954 [Amanita inopinata Kibby_2008]|nr:hypothetical protein AX17_002954 [Amanita inopinata Kibby_2008]
MDSHIQEHSQKDILSSLFSDNAADFQQRPGSDHHRHQHLQHQHSSQARSTFQFSSSLPSSPQHALGPGVSLSGQQRLYPHHSQPQSQAQPQIMMDMLGELMQMPVQGIESTSSAAPALGPAVGGPTCNPQLLLLDHQFKLTQLQQLQQLQQQIFQQQIALISGQPGSLFSGSSSLESQRDQSFAFNGLPTPAASSELRPQQQPLDFISPIILNNLMESTNGANAGSLNQHTHHSLPSSPAIYAASEGMASVINSPAILGGSNNQTRLIQDSNGFSSTSAYVHPGSISAPEYIAFHTSPSHNGLSSTADLDLDISPLTSPWLGAQQNHHQRQPPSFQTHSSQNQTPSRQPQQQPQQHSQLSLGQQPYHYSSSPSPSHEAPQYPSTPLSGPITTSGTTNINSNNKRSASPISADTDARKKQSPAIRPTNPNALSQHLDQQHQQQTRRSYRTGSRSTTSTPLMRARSGSTRQRKGGATTNNTLGTPLANQDVPGDSPSPVDLSMPPPAPPAPPNPALMSSSSGAVPPSPAVKPVLSGKANEQTNLTPVTPASIMKLGRLGNTGRGDGSGDVGDSSVDGKGKRLKVITDTLSGPIQTQQRRKRGAGTGGSTGMSLVSPSLKPILPGPTTSSSSILPLTPTSNSAGSGSNSIMTSIFPPQVRKTSHKAAEQKRRDSLKTTFDELRGLLPPIPLPSGSTSTTGGAGNQIGNSGEGEDGLSNNGGAVFGSNVKPLLPGALPPRGPPKAGGEGPNKSVSKLQLLICGNEYIRTLKGRVERRDEEIERLRKEVRRLREMVGVVGERGVMNDGERLGVGAAGVGVGMSMSMGNGMGVDSGAGSTMGVEGLMEQLDLDLDLERDIDAVEKGANAGYDAIMASAMSNGLINETATMARGMQRDGELMGVVVGDVAMDEDVGDEDED